MNRYIIAATFAIIVVTLSYVYNFYYVLKYPVSTETAVWGQLGDYTGGLLNPILSFLTIVLLIKSLKLQNQANIALRQELKNNKKTEKLNQFETHFFSMLNSQKTSFESFKIKTPQKGDVKRGVEAVIVIEETLEDLREKHTGDKIIIDLLTDVDSNDQLFSVTRRFYIMVKMISEKLSDANGFSAIDRRSHFMTLVNFTDFPLLRLIMMTMQFMEYKSIEYLKENLEFRSVLEEVRLGWDLY